MLHLGRVEAEYRLWCFENALKLFRNTCNAQFLSSAQLFLCMAERFAPLSMIEMKLAMQRVTVAVRIIV